MKRREKIENKRGGKGEDLQYSVDRVLKLIYPSAPNHQMEYITAKFEIEKENTQILQQASMTLLFRLSVIDSLTWDGRSTTNLSGRVYAPWTCLFQ